MALSDQDIAQLIGLRTENKNLDYKRSVNWGSCSKDEKVKIVKDILAIANTQDGGRIVFGVEDENFDFTGMQPDDISSFDPTTVNEFSHKYTDPKHSCNIYRKEIDGKPLVVIEVPEFAETPIICKKDYHSSTDSSEQILRKGQIYIRTDKATSEAISSPEEMRELLGRALTKKGDELLHLIDRLIKGKPLKSSDQSKEKYDAEIKEAESFLSEVIGEELKNRGYWAICAYPTEYDPRRLSDQKTIRELIQKSEVDLRGWLFPLTEPQNAVNFAKGRQSHTIWDKSVEAYRAYKSGLFISKRAFWEDMGRNENQDHNPVLSIVTTISLVTEIFLFLKRYYAEAVPEGDLYVKIVLNGTKNRSLISLNRDVFLRGPSTASDDQIPVIEENIKVVDLRASHLDIATHALTDLFLAFNWEYSEAYTRQWQTKLLEGKA